MLKAKKSLGQNFLNSQKIAEEIVAAGKVSPDDTVLEVGPGKGVLTELLLQRAKKVIAVEKDEELVEFLKEKFSAEINNGRLDVISGDILAFDPMSRFNLDIGGYKIIANLPYYITSFFLRKFLSEEPQPVLMVLMIQKEVADRIIGLGKKCGKRNSSFYKTDEGGNFSRRQVSFPVKESLLSISVKTYGRPEIIRIVSKGNFIPQPKVDSAVIRISGISKEFFKDLDEKNFFETVRKGFAHKRKLLLSNLGAKKENFAACGIAEKARAEDLDLEDWKCLNTVKVSP
ncbi:MAG: 16S rRNA (adenine(1518)-N(6)/adenine(1519)-N(6))-dimethyltransferase [Candidatus Pacebacteria bacterium]|nr:16S rRNA (adenine(1518)-N(6)/adenine(1519)-N(6))-dimethyltransferase [Candidatus Paceibacterota bacterium]NUQ56880.1 16S rRNA (adenine(1518)-N(6)/adenine(1519)-N(6))-dimethyltransferase [Candidatus Paceibacter sp.]